MESNVIHNKSKTDYLSNKSKRPASNSSKETPKLLENADKVDISPEGKELAKNANVETKNSTKDSSSSATSILKKAAKVPLPTPSLFPSSPGNLKKPSAQMRQKIEKETIFKPSIFFVSGFEFFGLSKDDTMEKMAANIPGAKSFKWTEQTEMMDEIKKHHRSQPIILVGHSLGANTAVKMTNELNTLDNGFRKVDLLVSMDAFGFNNDIIPPNVVKNLEFFGENNFFLNDGPNVARDTNVTQVINEIRVEAHTEIDDATDVQRKIFHGIDAVLASAKTESAVPLAIQKIEKNEKEETVIAPIIIIVEAEMVESDKMGGNFSEGA